MGREFQQMDELESKRAIGPAIKPFGLQRHCFDSTSLGRTREQILPWETRAPSVESNSVTHMGHDTMAKHNYDFRLMESCQTHENNCAKHFYQSRFMKSTLPHDTSNPSESFIHTTPYHSFAVLFQYFWNSAPQITTIMA